MRHKKTADANWNPARTLSTMGTEVKFPLTGLSGGTEYQAQASLDGTFATGVVSHTFTTLNEPGAPTGVTVTKDDKKLTVAWTAPTDTGGTDITGYKVQWKSGNQSFGVLAAAHRRRFGHILRYHRVDQRHRVHGAGAGHQQRRRRRLVR